MSGDPEWQARMIEQALIHGPDWREPQGVEFWSGWAARVGPCVGPEEWDNLLRVVNGPRSRSSPERRRYLEAKALVTHVHGWHECAKAG